MNDAQIIGLGVVIGTHATCFALAWAFDLREKFKSKRIAGETADEQRGRSAYNDQALPQGGAKKGNDEH